jgi:prepilin-type N-terminal cleavage/methylation domain-containing protein
VDLTARLKAQRGFSLIETMLVLGVMGVIAAIAVPMVGNNLAYYRLSGDARSNANAASLAKMRAASVFGHERLYVDITARTYRLETWDKATSTWIADGAASALSQRVTYSFGVVGAAPPNTQAAIAQPPLCKSNAVIPVDIANTACIIFNSRGLPIDNATPGQPFVYGLYVTDGSAIYGITVSATGTVRMWKTQPLAAPTWVLQ